MKNATTTLTNTGCIDPTIYKEDEIFVKESLYFVRSKLVEIARPFLGRFKVFPPTSTILEYFYTLLHGDLLHTPA